MYYFGAEMIVVLVLSLGNIAIIVLLTESWIETASIFCFSMSFSEIIGLFDNNLQSWSFWAKTAVCSPMILLYYALSFFTGSLVVYWYPMPWNGVHMSRIFVGGPAAGMLLFLYCYVVKKMAESRMYTPNQTVTNPTFNKAAMG